MNAPPKIGSAVPKKIGGLPIRTLQPGEKISEAGVYDISIERHHGDLCVGPSVSSSGLRTIEGQSLRHYWWDSYHNPNREPFETSKGMTLGSAAHWLLLGQSSYGWRNLFELQPEECPDGSGPWSANKKVCRAWTAEQRLAGKSILTQTMLDNIKGMADALARHPDVPAMFRGEAEKTLVVRDKETGVWLKCRPDVLAGAGEVRVDLKTTTDASPLACSRSLSDYGLHQQAAIVCEIQEQLFGWERRDTGYYLVFVETSAPYAVSVRPVDEDAIAYGRVLNRRALRRLADALSKDEWPAYEKDHETVGVTKWMREQYEQQIKLGLLMDPATLEKEQAKGRRA